MVGPYFTVFEVLQQALQLIGAVSFGESIEPAVTQSALLQLNAMLRKWSNSYVNYTTYDKTITLSANQSVITMGSAVNGEFATSAIGDISERPASIEQVDIIMGTLTFPVKIKSYAEYTKLPIKNVVTIPNTAYYKESMPFDELWFFPMVPSGYSVKVIGKSYLPQYSSISDLVVMPPEYVDALISNLALKIIPMFGQNPSEGLIIMANSALKHIKYKNVANTIPRSINDFGSGSGHNFWGGF